MCALIPAIRPCPPASSYPEVPFTCPAKNRFLIIFDSRECFNCVGSNNHTQWHIGAIYPILLKPEFFLVLVSECP
jgi:hypothetical protein